MDVQNVWPITFVEQWSLSELTVELGASCYAGTLMLQAMSMEGKDSPKVRSAAQVHDERFKECVTLQAQYIYDSFGKFPGTIPSMFLIIYLQVHHLDLEFYDRFYKPGSYLKTHAMHMAKWHSEESKDKP